MAGLGPPQRKASLWRVVLGQPRTADILNLSRSDASSGYWSTVGSCCVTQTGWVLDWQTLWVTLAGQFMSLCECCVAGLCHCGLIPTVTWSTAQVRLIVSSIAYCTGECDRRCCCAIKKCFTQSHLTHLRLHLWSSVDVKIARHVCWPVVLAPLFCVV